MLKGRSKTFTPRKLTRNIPKNQTPSIVEKSPGAPKTQAPPPVLEPKEDTTLTDHSNCHKNSVDKAILIDKSNLGSPKINEWSHNATRFTHSTLSDQTLDTTKNIPTHFSDLVTIPSENHTHSKYSQSCSSHVENSQNAEPEITHFPTQTSSREIKDKQNNYASERATEDFSATISAPANPMENALNVESLKKGNEEYILFHQNSIATERGPVRVQIAKPSGKFSSQSIEDQEIVTCNFGSNNPAQDNNNEVKSFEPENLPHKHTQSQSQSNIALIDSDITSLSFPSEITNSPDSDLHHAQRTSVVSGLTKAVDSNQVASIPTAKKIKKKKKKGKSPARTQTRNNFSLENNLNACKKNPIKFREAPETHCSSPQEISSHYDHTHSHLNSSNTQGHQANSTSASNRISSINKKFQGADNTSPDVDANGESSIQNSLPVANLNTSDIHNSPPKKKRKYTRKPPMVEDKSPTGIKLKKRISKLPKQNTGRNRGRKREQTPEGAETKKIDPAVITMQDLCRDLRIGKKSKNHDEIMGRLAQVKNNAVRAKMQRDHPELVDLISSEGDEIQTRRQNQRVNTSAKKSASPSPPTALLPASGPKIRIVDGQIVTDEQSLQIDRHKLVRENAYAEKEIVEENDFSRVVTSSNYLKRERSQHWDIPANELFWKGLRMFGTDFEMIAKMFPHRNRRQIKLKFNAEERINPQKINRVLMGIKTETIDLDEFQRLGNIELEDLADIKAEQAKTDHEQAEYLKAIEAREIEIRQRRSGTRGGDSAKRLFDDISDGENEASKNSSKTRKDLVKNRKSKRNMHSIFGGGEEAIVMESYA